MFANILFALAAAITTIPTTTTPTQADVVIQTQVSETGVFYKNINEGSANTATYTRIVVQTADVIIVSNPFVLHTFEAPTTASYDLSPESIDQERVPIINGLEDF